MTADSIWPDEGASTRERSNCRDGRKLDFESAKMRGALAGHKSADRPHEAAQARNRAGADRECLECHGLAGWVAGAPLVLTIAAVIPPTVPKGPESVDRPIRSATAWIILTTRPAVLSISSRCAGRDRSTSTARKSGLLLKRKHPYQRLKPELIREQDGYRGIF